MAEQKGESLKGASKMRCPFSRIFDEHGSYNIDPDKKGNVGNCITEDCMMWRWHNEDYTTGFCGLAGAKGL